MSRIINDAMTEETAGTMDGTSLDVSIRLAKKEQESDKGLIEAYTLAYEEVSELPPVADTPMPPRLQHTHTGKQGWWYAGMSDIAIGYHRYRCRGSDDGCPQTMIRPCMTLLGSYAECLVCKVEDRGVS